MNAGPLENLLYMHSKPMARNRRCTVSGYLEWKSNLNLVDFTLIFDNGLKWEIRSCLLCNAAILFESPICLRVGEQWSYPLLLSTPVTFVEWWRSCWHFLSILMLSLSLMSLQRSSWQQKSKLMASVGWNKVQLREIRTTHNSILNCS